MQTRSQTRNLLKQFEIDIDFDKASRAWMQNKKRVGQSYVYICGKCMSTGKPCQREPVEGQARCKRHSIFH